MRIRTEPQPYDPQHDDRTIIEGTFRERPVAVGHVDLAEVRTPAGLAVQLAMQSGNPELIETAQQIEAREGLGNPEAAHDARVFLDLMDGDPNTPAMFNAHGFEDRDSTRLLGKIAGGQGHTTPRAPEPARFVGNAMPGSPARARFQNPRPRIPYNN